MKKKKQLIGLLSFAFLFLWNACEMKHDANGDLDGMWQMMVWYDKIAKDTVKTKYDGIYYCVQLKLMKFYKRGNSMHYHLAYFRHVGDSLFVGKIVDYPGDTICTTSVLKDFGVPQDGKFRVNALSSERMILSTDSIELTFRKY